LRLRQAIDLRRDRARENVTWNRLCGRRGGKSENGGEAEEPGFHSALF
jgi:hypothetical protein